MQPSEDEIKATGKDMARCGHLVMRLAMGVLLAGMLQIALPLATCFPGMIYRVINPDLQDTNAAYPEVVAAVVPIGLRGLVAAAVMGAIMSTIAGLVNSTSTMMTRCD